MIRNYLIIAWRNLIKNKVHSVINIAGLSVGMSVAMLIGLWIWDELSFDSNHKNRDTIAQVIQNVTNNGEVQTWQSGPPPLAAELRKNYGSFFKQVVNSAGYGDHMLALANKKLNRTGMFMEPNGPEMFTLQMPKGNRNALTDPSSILISASRAKAYFGDSDPINKTLKIDNRYKSLGACLKICPQMPHLQASILSRPGIWDLPPMISDRCVNHGGQTFVRYMFKVPKMPTFRSSHQK